MMKRFVLMFAAFGVLFACTPEENNTGDNNGNHGTVHVTGISLDRPTATINEGESITLVATVNPANANNKNVTWSTSSEAVATVDNNGKVTGVEAGSATITATTEDGGKKATCALSVEANLAPSVTVEANQVSAISAVLAGKANLGSTVASDLKIGFQYSKSAGILPTNSTTVDAEEADANYNFTTGITELEPATKYYFRSFVRQNGQDTYGETKEFTTKDVASLLETNEASDVEAEKATLNAKLNLTDVQYKSLAYGFLWGSSKSALNTDFSCTEIKDNAIAATLTSLPHKTQYWYKAYVKLDSQTFYGEVKTFTTDIVPVESVSLDKSEYTFNTIGNTQTFNATVLPADATDKRVEWSSDSENVATVDANGRVTAKGNGKAKITVTTKDQGKTASCEVTVAQLVTSISLNQTSLTLNEGQTANLSVSAIVPDNANDKSFAWSSSDDSVATVDNSGKVTAKSKGSATIKATATDGSGKYASCSVTVKRLVSSIQLSKASLVIYNGKSKTLTATVTPSSANNTSVTWTSSNSSVATVSSSGKVTGKAKGTVTITVTANDGSGVKATCSVEVKQHVTSITLSRSSLSLWVGESKTITVVSVKPNNANDKTYTWSSSNSSVATVDSNGMITANAKGSADIKATANDGSNISATCSVQVDIMPDAVDMGTVVNGKNIKWASFNVGASAPQEYGYYYAWGEIKTKDNYSWSTYKFGSSTEISKYNDYSQWGDPVDNKLVLDKEDDIAYVKFGGKWRMPTESEWSALLRDCIWEWTGNYNNTGVEGMLVTAPNGNSIFLPAGGYRVDYGSKQKGSHGKYWSSSLYHRYQEQAFRAYSLHFTPSSREKDNAARFQGYSVRPVSE